ncbi:MAG: DMT family transporter, partial [Chloroflexi bacterium]|nr:DMT family transporter [Chloroflexota bacterium]
MPGVGGGELIVIAVIVLIVFGAGRLPEALGQLRRGVRAPNEETPREGDDREPPDTPPSASSPAEAPAEQAQPRTRAVLGPRSGAVTAAAFAGVVMLASLTFLAVRAIDRELPPFAAAAIRFAAAGLFFLVYSRLRGLARPRGRALAGAVVFGLTAFFGAYALLYRGLPAVSAGMGAVALALVPLMTLALAALHGLERPLRRTLLGGALTTAGIVVVVRDQLAVDAPPLAALALLAGVACAAESGVVVKYFPRSHPAATNAIAMPVGALAL